MTIPEIRKALEAGTHVIKGADWVAGPVQVKYIRKILGVYLNPNLCLGISPYYKLVKVADGYTWHGIESAGGRKIIDLNK